jgi:hypothetical protein
MRMAFGLGGLLVTIGVIVWIMGKAELPYDQAAIHASQQASTAIQQVSGRDENGNNIETTYSVFADTRSDGKLQDLQVTQLTPDSPLAHYFGLQKDDVILACIDGHTVRTDMAGLNDDRAGKDAIWDAYTQQGQMIVQRGEQQLTLPVVKTQSAPTPQQAPSPTVTAQQSQKAQRTEQQQEGKSNDGSTGGSMDEIRQRLHALPTY